MSHLQIPLAFAATSLLVSRWKAAVLAAAKLADAEFAVAFAAEDLYKSEAGSAAAKFQVREVMILSTASLAGCSDQHDIMAARMTQLPRWRSSLRQI